MVVKTLPDIAGDNAAHQLTASLIYAKWVQFTAAGGTGSPRVGDANVSASRGLAVPSAVASTSPPVDFPIVSDPLDNYALNSLYAYVPTGTTLTITYGA